MGHEKPKHVSGTILDTATKVRVETSVLRVDQIGGPLSPKSGEWNRNEGVRTLLKTPQALSCILDKLVVIE